MVRDDNDILREEGRAGLVDPTRGLHLVTSRAGSAPSPAVPVRNVSPADTPRTPGEELEAQRTADAALAALSIGAALAEEESALEVGPQHIATGWARLDTMLGGGLALPSLNVLGAAPKSGKSTWAQIIAERHAEAGGFVYYLDLENGRRRFVRRMLCRKAKLGAKQIARALRDHRAGVFTSRADVERWQAAKVWMREELGNSLFVEYSPPQNFEARIGAARRAAGSRRLLVVIDSLQKLPMPDLSDRRAGVDAWIRLLEGLRHKYEAAVLLISEIKRAANGKYDMHESAFKESGGIEYAADLAMGLTRPTADEDRDAASTLSVQLARDCDEDPRGLVASYRPLFPFYGLEELEAERPPRKSNGASSTAKPPLHRTKRESLLRPEDRP